MSFFLLYKDPICRYVLDTQVNGVELATDSHLVVSWIQGQSSKPDRPDRPKPTVKVCGEDLAESSSREGWEDLEEDSGRPQSGTVYKNTVV